MTMKTCERLSDEHAMIARIQRGDRQALEALLLAHRPLLYALAGRIRGGQMHMDELVQAGYVGMMLAVQRYDAQQKTRFITYAVPWIIGEMKRVMRRYWQTCAELSLEAPREDDGGALGDTLPATEAINLEHLDIRLAMEQLADEERMLICLRYFRDKSQKETARLIGKSQAQVSRMEQRILDRLHAKLSG